MIFSIAVMLEIGLLVAAGWHLQLGRGYGVAESLAVSLVAVPALLSFFIQTAFLIQLPAVSLLPELLLLLAAVYLLKGSRRSAVHLFSTLRHFAINYPVICTLFMLVVLYLGAQALLLPEGNYDSMRYNLARVLLFEQENSLFLTSVTELHQALFPVGGDILAHLFLRFHSDDGVAIFSFMAWLSIAAASYAMARRETDEGRAITTMLMVISLPELVFQATGSKPDLMAAATAVCCMLLLNRMLERFSFHSLAMLLLLLCFGVSAKATFLAFAIPFAAVCAYLMIRQHGFRRCYAGLIKYRLQLLALLIPMAVLGQIWLFVHNVSVWGGWSGPPWFVALHTNADGAWGMLANIVRYAFQSINLLMPVDQLVEEISGAPLSGYIRGIYASVFEPLFAHAGMAPLAQDQGDGRFSIIWQPNESGAWFGPIGFLLVIPALFFALFRGSAVLRCCAFALLCYGLLISYSIGWMPWNSRFFSLLFACSAGSVALLLEHLREKQWLHTGLRSLAILILIYACCFNQQKPLIRFLTLNPVAMVQGGLEYNIWRETDWGRDRQYYTRKFYGDDRVYRFTELVGKGKRVGVVSRGIVWLYPYMKARPDLHFIVEPAKGAHSTNSVDYLLCMNSHCDQPHLAGKKGELLWIDSGKPGLRKGALYTTGADM